MRSLENSAPCGPPYEAGRESIAAQTRAWASNLKQTLHSSGSARTTLLTVIDKCTESVTAKLQLAPSPMLQVQPQFNKIISLINLCDVPGHHAMIRVINRSCRVVNVIMSDIDN